MNTTQYVNNLNKAHRWMDTWINENKTRLSDSGEWNQDFPSADFNQFDWCPLGRNDLPIMDCEEY